MKKASVEYLTKRFSEASTWRGLIMVITAFGMALSPEQIEAIVTAGIFLSGFVGTFFPDAKS